MCIVTGIPLQEYLLGGDEVLYGLEILVAQRGQRCVVRYLGSDASSDEWHGGVIERTSERPAAIIRGRPLHA